MSDRNPSPVAWTSLIGLPCFMLKLNCLKIPQKVRVKLFDIEFLSRELEEDSAVVLYKSLLDYVEGKEHSEAALLITLQTVLYEFYK